MAYKLFAELKAYGETLNDKERIEFLESCLEGVLEHLSIEKEERLIAKNKANEAERKLIELKNAIRELL